MPGDIKGWLEGLGLGHYSETFTSQAIGFDILPDLTDGDLKDLGVALGDRKRLLKAIARLDQDLASAPTPPGPVEGDAERRQLTVMFCDLVGSTELSQKLDPEDLREVNAAYQDACKSAIERYEGYVARYMGDGVLAYFGYPRAHEDDAGRAVHAGLDLVAAMKSLNAGVGNKIEAPLEVRVGIATGPVVVGDLVGEGASQESAVVGETPNLAARLQALASPNTVVIADGTHDIAGGRFDYEDLGVQALKGIASPVQTWRVIAPATVESRFEALHRTGYTPLVGREHEVGLLMERWEQAKEGDGQVVLLSGTAGIGKSRISETISERTAVEQPIRLRYQCSPYHTNSSLHPVIEQLERAVRFDAEESVDAKLDKLESLLSRAGANAKASARLFAPLLSIPTEGRYAPLDMTPERQKEQTLEALANQLEGLSRKNPVLFIFEDVHWADPTSLELLDLTVERIQDLAVLAVITLRPEFSPPWMDHTHVTSLTLNRFTRSLAARMIEEVTGGKRLPDEVREQIIEKTDGVPLFVEELTKSILESEQLTEEDNAFVLSGSLAELAIPATLHDSLIARLDRLGAVKEVAQSASAIGREFDYDLLAAVSPLSFAELRDAVEQLIDAGLVFRQGRAAETRYVFKHALVRDAAYGSMLRGTRQELHGRIAGALKVRFPETGETQPELLAHHYTEAGEPGEAVGYWLQAGRRANERSANQEAMRHLEKGLAVLQTLPPSKGRSLDELALNSALFTPLMAVEGYTSDGILEVCDRVRELCESTGETEELFLALYGQWAHHFVGGNFSGGLSVAEEMLELAERHQDQPAVLSAHRLIGWGALILGDLPRGRHHLEIAAELYDPEIHLGLGLRYGHNPLVATLAGIATHQWATGHSEQARQSGLKAIDHGRKSGHAASLSYALTFGGAQLAALARDPEATLEFSNECMALGREQGIRSFRGWNMAAAGWAKAKLGKHEEGKSLLVEGLNDLARAGVEFPLSLYRVLHAESCMESGDLPGAKRILTVTLDSIRQSGERWYESEVYRLLGEVQVRMAARSEGEALFRCALEIARELGEKTLELRASISITRLLTDEGDSAKARANLASVYESFTEGCDTPDLEEAKVLLDQLA